MEPSRGDEPPVLPEPKSVTVVCPECQEIVRLRDVHAFVLSKHLDVCAELSAFHSE